MVINFKNYTVKKLCFFILVAAFICWGKASDAQSSFPYSDSFTHPASNGTTFGGSPQKAYLTSSPTAAGAANVPITPDADGNGFLRLTAATTVQTGYIYNNTGFSSTDGFSISFEYYTYGGTGADGITFFLFDAGVFGLGSAGSGIEGVSGGYVTGFNIGGFGGSLGYAQNTTNHPAGLRKAYFGIALDEFGNFSNTNQGRAGGIGADIGNVQRPSSITLRGDGDGTGTTQSGFGANTNYEFLKNIQTSSATAMASVGGGPTFPIAGNVNGRSVISSVPVIPAVLFRVNCLSIAIIDRCLIAFQKLFHWRMLISLDVYVLKSGIIKLFYSKEINLTTSL